MNKIKAILFDLDGTLLDSAPDFLYIINLMLERHSQQPISLVTVTQQASNGANAMLATAFKISIDSSELSALKAEFLERYLELINVKSSLYPNVNQLLDYLDEQGILWGVVTNKPAKYTQLIMDHFKLSNRTKAIICPDHVKHPKPNPQSLFLAGSYLGISNANTWYVGDHLRDIQAGQAAQMTTVGCRYGYLNSHDECDTWGADFIIDQPQQLIALIEQHQPANLPISDLN